MSVPARPAPHLAPGWTPLLTGEDAVAARACVQRLTAHLQRQTAAGAPLWTVRADERVTLAAGLPGLALFFAERSRTDPHAGHQTRALALLDAATDVVAAFDPMPARWPGLHTGITGVGWVNDHLGGWLIEGDANEALDETLLDWLARPAADDSHDLIHGLVGIGVYALSRLDLGRGALIQQVLRRLADLARPQAHGTIWLSPPGRGRPHPFDGWHVDLGMAHGLTGVIGLLARLHSRLRSPAAGDLLGAAARWLLRQSDPERPGARFPTAIDQAGRGEPGRGGWCYGDLSTALALAQAAEALDDPGLRRYAGDIACEQARQQPVEDDQQDACLCHGAAGIAHLFARLYGTLGEPVLATAARRWYRQTLALGTRAPAEQGGFMFWDQGAGERAPRWRSSLGFLTGGAGVALALLAALDPVSPRWDWLLLSDALPGAQGPRLLG